MKRPVVTGGSLVAILITLVATLTVGTHAAVAADSTTQLQWDLAGLSYLPFSGIDGGYGSETTAAVRAFQTDQCLTTDGSASPQTESVLSNLVKLVQDTVGVPSDGSFGSATKSAVASWQSAHNLTADGAAGPMTMAAMIISRDHDCGGPTPNQPGPDSSSAAALQWDLAGLGYLPWSGVDGSIGPQTESATMAFQSDRCMSVDGVAGPQTESALSTVIEAVQENADVAVDGSFGPDTRSGVASWQARHNLIADGQAGSGTMAAMGVARAMQCTAPPNGTPTPSTSPTLQLQWDLAGLSYLPWTGIDGLTGPHTAGATMAFQSDRCLSVDGVAGSQTNSALAGVVSSVQRAVGITADGSFGVATKAAVATWQSSHGLTADGQAGPRTMSAMGVTRTVACANPPAAGSPVSGDIGSAIVSVAIAQMNDASRNHEIGGYNCNYYTTALGLLGTGAHCSNGWKTEAWCADFATWVWKEAGINVGGLTGAASSFYAYGRTHGTWHTGTPRVGDAVVFGLSSDGSYAEHVGLVVGVSGATFSMISGNTSNPADGQDDVVRQVTLNSTGGGIAGFADPMTTQPASANQSAFNYFVTKGLTKVQAAGVVGNLDQESGMDPAAKQYPSGLGRGIAQWSVGGRWDSDTNDNAAWYASTQGQDVWTLTPQLGFAWYELLNYSHYGLTQLRASSSVYDSVVAFENDFEGCGTCMTDNRVRYANQILAYYG